MPLHKLKALAVQALNKPNTKHSDGGGLYLQIGPTGRKSWFFQFTSPATGRERQFGLGSADTVSLKQAREKALAARTLVQVRKDPIDERDHALALAVEEAAEAKRLADEAAAPMTFEVVATRYIAAKTAEWRNVKHAEQWTATLRTYAYPHIGSMPVATIGVSDIRKILDPIWTTKSETANRVRGRIENILDAAKAEGHRSGDNPARWRGHLDKLLAKPSKVHKVRPMPALPYKQAPAFMASLQERDGISARALEILILTASRTGALIGMRESEIDFEEKIWTVPASRMKGGREHVVPLSDKAIEIIQALPHEKDSPFIFPGTGRHSHLSNMALLALMKHAEPNFVPHGFRSTFADWAYEETPTPRFIVEMALAHAVDDKTEAAYRRGDLLKKRRRLMTRWANYLFPVKAADDEERQGHARARTNRSHDPAVVQTKTGPADRAS